MPVRLPSARARPSYTIAFAVSFLAGIERTAEAAPSDAPSVELEWVGPGSEATCLGAARLTAAVNEYLGREAITEPPGERRLRVEVERHPKSWSAHIQLVDLQTKAPLGERELGADGPLCSGLDEALKLSVALLLDDDLSQAPATPEPQVAPRPEPRPKLDPEPEPEPDLPAAEPSEPWRFSLDASVVALGAMLPALAAGTALGFEASPKRWLALRAQGAAFLPQTREVAPGASFTAGVLFGGVSVCPRAELAPSFSLSACFGFQGGRLWVTRSGFSDGKDAARRLLASSAGARLSYELGARVTLNAEFAALLPVRQDRFLAEFEGNSRELFAVSVVPWVAGLGLSGRL